MNIKEAIEYLEPISKHPVMTGNYVLALRVALSALCAQQKTERVLAREGFADIETMIARYKQVMHDANELSIERDAELESLKTLLAESQRRARDARNELCLKCGRYREAHNGACDGCRWKVVEK